MPHYVFYLNSRYGKIPKEERKTSSWHTQNNLTNHMKRGATMKLFFGTILFILLSAGNVYAEMVAVSGNLVDIRSSPSLVVSIVLLQVPRYYPLSTQGAQGDFFKVSATFVLLLQHWK